MYILYAVDTLSSLFRPFKNTVNPELNNKLTIPLGDDWLNRLTTTDGVEITFDPLLLEDDKEDQSSVKEGR